MRRAQIHFYSRKRLAMQWPDINQLTAEDIPKHQQRFRSGIDTWVVQTYLQTARALRERGFTVTIGNQISSGETGNILVAHRDDLNTFFQSLHRTFIVGIRTDRSDVEVADIEVLQNGLHLEKPNQYFVPSWPQPGIIKRDPARANRIERIGYFGRKDSLPAWFFEGSFTQALTARGISFEVRHQDWHDYHDIDLVLAHRIEAPSMLEQKPAAKLCNAWLAGVPALLSPEPAYQEQRQSEFDYLEIESATDVLTAIDRLQIENGLYNQMRQQAAIRAPAFCADAVRSHWITFFDQMVYDQYRLWRTHSPTWKSWTDFAYKLIRQKQKAQTFRKSIYAELATTNKINL